MKYLLLLTLTVASPLWALDCTIEDFAGKYVVESTRLQAGDETTLLTELCETSAFTGKVRVDEIWLNDVIMGFESRGRLTFMARYRPIGSEGGYEASLEKTADVWVHEYGHAVLKHRLLSRHPEWQTHLVKNQERAFLQDEFLDCAQRQCPDMLRLLDRIRNFWEPGEQDRVMDFVKAYVVYDEMYADVVTVLKTGNPSVIYQAFDYPGIETYKDTINQRRDFALNHEHSDQVADPHYHGVMAYTRHWLWVNFIPFHEKAEVLTRLELAIEAEMKVRIANGEYDLSNREINERFIRRLSNR